MCKTKNNKQKGKETVINTGIIQPTKNLLSL